MPRNRPQPRIMGFFAAHALAHSRPVWHLLVLALVALVLLGWGAGRWPGR